MPREGAIDRLSRQGGPIPQPEHPTARALPPVMFTIISYSCLDRVHREISRARVSMCHGDIIRRFRTRETGN